MPWIHILQYHSWMFTEGNRALLLWSHLNFVFWFDCSREGETAVNADKSFIESQPISSFVVSIKTLFVVAQRQITVVIWPLSEPWAQPPSKWPLCFLSLSSLHPHSAFLKTCLAVTPWTLISCRERERETWQQKKRMKDLVRDS